MRRAVETCQTCPVKRTCLDTALSIEASADVGIWGGTTPHARRRLRRERQRAAGAAGWPTLVPQRPSEPLAAKTEGLHLVQDDNGDFIDRSGRVIVFEIHGDPPFMLMIDRQPRARTQTVADAAGLAAKLLAQTAVAGEVRDEDPLQRCHVVGGNAVSPSAVLRPRQRLAASPSKRPHP